MKKKPTKRKPLKWVQKTAKVPQGDYGVVRVVSGNLAGYLGYYDDDLGEDDAGPKSVALYLVGLPPAPYEVVSLNDLGQATADEKKRWWDAFGDDLPGSVKEMAGVKPGLGPKNVK